MYDQMTAQFKKSMKPMNDMMEINVKTMEALAQKQTSIFTEALQDSMAYTKSITSQTDLPGVIQVQKEFSEDFQAKMIEASKDVYTILTEAQDKAAQIFKGAYTQAVAMAPVMPTPEPKTAKSKAAAK